MFEQDYIMRLIKEMVRALLKLLFGIDTQIQAPSAQLLEDAKERQILEELLDLVDAGQIEQAENRLYDLTEQERRVDLEMAVLFYSYLNDKSDEFLEAHHFCREEVRLGLEDFARRFGLGGMAEIFLHGGSTEN